MPSTQLENPNAPLPYPHLSAPLDSIRYRCRCTEPDCGAVHLYPYPSHMEHPGTQQQNWPYCDTCKGDLLCVIEGVIIDLRQPDLAIPEAPF